MALKKPGSTASRKVEAPKSSGTTKKTNLIAVVEFVEDPIRVGGQCAGDCTLPVWDNQGNNIRCQSDPSCTAVTCKCNLWETPKGTTNWKKVASQGVWYTPLAGMWYRCWCTK